MTTRYGILAAFVAAPVAVLVLSAAALVTQVAAQDADAAAGDVVEDTVAEDTAAEDTAAEVAAVESGQQPGFLGLIGDDRGNDGRGVRIVKVDRDSPADAGMLKEGDLIYKINDQPIRNGRDMMRVLSQLPAGSNVRFFVDRDGSQKERDVTLGQRPAAGERERDFGVIGEPLPPPRRGHSSFGPPTPQAGPSGVDMVLPAPPTPHRATLGVRSVPPTELDKVQHGLPNQRGAVVLSIAAGSPAHQARIPLQAVIVAIDGKNVSGPTDLARRIATYEPGQEVEVSYYYKREHHRQRLTLGDAYEVDGQQQFTTSDVTITTDGSNQAGGERIATLERQVDALARRVEELERTIQELRRANRP